MNISAVPILATAIQQSTAEVTTGNTTKSTQDNDKPFNKTQFDSALTQQELKEIQSLKSRDREVRAHEAAHLAAAGELAQGGATFSYQRGPDGVRYAVGGEVKIDTAAVQGDPVATLEKAQRIRAAALAPAQPSSQDLNVAAQAAQLAVQARAEISQQATTSTTETTADDNKPEDATAIESGDADLIRSTQQTETTTRHPFISNDSVESIINLVA